MSRGGWLRFLAIGAAVFVGASARAGAPQTFLYQGQLKHAGVPLNDVCRFEFVLWDAEIEGRRVDEPILLERVEVVDGLFEAPLTVRPGTFDGRTLWLEMSLACEGTRAEATLRPRQPIMPAPYALFALDAPGGSSGELTLPYAGTNTADEVAFSVANSGLLSAASFGNSNASNNQAAVNVANLGSGPGLLSLTSGAGPAVWGLTGDGGGLAGLFRVGGTTGTQAALGAENQAMGSAGHFRVLTDENSSPALFAEHGGSGSAARFLTLADPNVTNGTPTVKAENEAGGSAGFFQTTDSESSAHVLAAEGSGSGASVFANARGTGNAIYGYSSFGGHGVRGLIDEGTGKAGTFEINSSSNGNPAVEGVTNGTGPAGYFQNTRTTGGGIGVHALGRGTGTGAPALRAENFNLADGIAMFGRNESPNSTLVLRNLGSGDLIRGFNSAGVLSFAVRNNGHVATSNIRVEDEVLSGSFAYIAPKTYYYTVGPADFSPEPGGEVSFDNPGWESTSGQFIDAYAPVHLPDGARVTQARVYYSDRASENLHMHFMSVNLATGIRAEYFEVLSSGSGGFGSVAHTFPGSGRVIDNNGRAYYLRAWAMDGSCGTLDPCDWADNVDIMGVTFTYEMDGPQ